MRFTRAVFIRLIGGIFLLAFLSAAVQMQGLYGTHGISPVSALLGQANGQPGLEHMLSYPSIFWFDSSDSFLTLVPVVGVLFSLLVLLGILSGPGLAVSWFLYLSIVTVGQEFMSFQWDILLLETGFLCIFLASWRPFDFLYSLFEPRAFNTEDSQRSTVDQSASSSSSRDSADPLISGRDTHDDALSIPVTAADSSDLPAGSKQNSVDSTFSRLNLPLWTVDRVEPPVALIWLSRLLLFRLMFQSGLCKLESGDEYWRNLTAMTYHYETQPLPTPLGWFAHQLPDPVLQLSTVFVFVLEIILPLFVFAGRRGRLAVAIGTVSLQVLILLTGNYCFFNLLTIALCLLLVDDVQLYQFRWKNWQPRVLTEINSRITEVATIRPNGLRNLVVVPLTILIVFLTTNKTIFAATASGLPPLFSITALFQPWHLVSNYGLFAVMTTSRPEIVIEGSNDGKNWLEYSFKYKPGALDRAPPIVAPHQPRLDWQMWFAALGTVFENQWLVSFVEKLLEGSPDVLALLESDPFHGKPPKYIRASVFDYHMTDFSTLLSTGKWWQRTYKGVYLPAITKTVEL